MKDMPRVTYAESTYDIDEVLDTLESKGFINPKYKQGNKEQLLKNKHCNTILGLLQEFGKLWYYADNQSVAKKRGITQRLIALDSPILFFVD